MRTTYLILVLVAVIALGWAIHYYSDRAVFGPGGEPANFGMIAAPAARAV
jgi:hypothetical protein